MHLTVLRPLMWLLAATLLPALACKKGPEYDWPDQPTDGCPVAIEFLELEGEGERVQAKLRIFNFSETRVEGVSMLLHYQNEAGEELEVFPWSANSPSLAEPEGVGHTEAGAFIPEATTQVGVTVEEVRFSGGTTWDAPE